MPEPWVTVCVALYNRAEWVGECIRSIQAQLDPDWRLLVADDGSTDGGADIVAAMGDPRIEVLRLPHRGCWATKNALVREVTTPWLVFVDSDDLLRSDCLSRARAVLRDDDEYVYPTAVEIVHEDLSPTGRIWRYKQYARGEELWRLFWQNGVNGVPHAGAFIQSAIFDRVGLFDDSLTNHADMMFTIEHAAEVRWRLDTEVQGYVNRQHERQTNRNALARSIAQAKALRWIIDHAPSQAYLHIPPPDESGLLRLWVDALMRRAVDAGDADEPFREAAMPLLRRLRELAP